VSLNSSNTHRQSQRETSFSKHSLLLYSVRGVTRRCPRNVIRIFFLYCTVSIFYSWVAKCFAFLAKGIQEATKNQNTFVSG
jgi:glutaminase